MKSRSPGSLRQRVWSRVTVRFPLSHVLRLDSWQEFQGRNKWTRALRQRPVGGRTHRARLVESRDLSVAGVSFRVAVPSRTGSRAGPAVSLHTSCRSVLSSSGLCLPPAPAFSCVLGNCFCSTPPSIYWCPQNPTRSEV